MDRATLAVLAVRSLPTPTPTLDADSDFSDEEILRLTGALCAVAQASVPLRTRTGNRWSSIAGELVTVVCREGEAEITPAEAQYFWGWRYSDHGTVALNGDVYVVTPQGWATLGGEWCGARPVLAANADGLARLDGARTAAEVQEAERILADASTLLLGPYLGECLLCYVHRMLMEYGCNCRLRFAGHYRDVRAPRATALERRLGQSGGYCDCEIFLNSYNLRLEYLLSMVITEREDDDGDDDEDRPEVTVPNPLPLCREVRAGSTPPEIGRLLKFHGTSPNGRQLRTNRDALIALLAAYRLGNVRVFGSTARETDREGSDIDLLVTAEADLGLLSQAQVEQEASELLRCPVDLVFNNAIRVDLRMRILSEAVPL